MSRSPSVFGFSAGCTQKGCSQHSPRDPGVDFKHLYPLGLFQALPPPGTSAWPSGEQLGLAEHPAVGGRTQPHPLPYASCPCTRSEDWDQLLLLLLPEAWGYKGLTCLFFPQFKRMLKQINLWVTGCRAPGPMSVISGGR